MARRLQERKPLEHAFLSLCHAAEVLRHFSRDKDYLAKQGDFLLLGRIHDKAQELRLISTHLETCLRCRLVGEPEPPPMRDTF